MVIGVFIWRRSSVCFSHLKRRHSWRVRPVSSYRARAFSTAFLLFCAQSRLRQSLWPVLCWEGRIYVWSSISALLYSVSHGARTVPRAMYCEDFETSRDHNHVFLEQTPGFSRNSHPTSNVSASFNLRRRDGNVSLIGWRLAVPRWCARHSIEWRVDLNWDLSNFGRAV